MKKSSGSGDRPLLISASLATGGKALRLQTDCAHPDQETAIPRRQNTPPPQKKKHLQNKLKEGIPKGRIHGKVERIPLLDQRKKDAIFHRDPLDPICPGRKRGRIRLRRAGELRACQRWRARAGRLLLFTFPLSFSFF
jgi:hypothetical protein